MDAPPFDIGFTFDARLREVPNDPAAMASAVDWLRERAAATAGVERARALSEAGALARMLGRLDEALLLLETARTALAAAEPASLRLATVTALRLAHVHQQRGDFARSDALFAALLARIDATPALATLRATALQHAGKNAFDQGRLDEAERCFAAALELRRQQGDAALVASSQQALDLTRALRGRAAAP